MRHYGLPTRLLDWTRSPIIAAYFALEDYIYGSASPHEDAAIWVLQPHRLNLSDVKCDVTPGIEANMVANLIEPAFLDKAPEPNTIMAVMASEHDLRIFVQQGCFTVHSDRTPLNLRDDAGRYLTRLVIPQSCIAKFSREIEICGIRKGDIYPDLQHLAEELRIKKGA